MSLDAGAVLTAIADHARQLGVFERVHTHEPRTAPGNGVTLALWSDGITPTRASGLAAVSVRLPFSGRIYVPGDTEPQDAIDPTLLSATSTFLGALAGDFELGGDARMVDIFGADGQPMGGQAAYLKMDDREYRIMSLSVAVIVNDAWTEAP